MHKLVLLRHGESISNAKGIFTGWFDSDLCPAGVEEAHTAARHLKENGYTFDVAFTSLLKRAIRTLWIVLDDMDLMWIPVHRSWRLNERHYGDLQGRSKKETLETFGHHNYRVWRRSYDIPPPAIGRDDERWPGHDLRYASLARSDLPTSESLEDMLDRFLPYWQMVIAPVIRTGKRVVISAHGNNLRGLMKYLDLLSDQTIEDREVPWALPLVYELDHDLHPIRHYYLGDPKEVECAVAAVARHGIS